MDEMEEILETLDKTGTFYVTVYPRSVFGDDQKRRLPPHRLVVEPLVQHSLEIRIYGQDERSPLFDRVLSMGERRRGYILVNLSRDAVRGHEQVWNADSWRRGALVLAAQAPDSTLAEVFHWCSGPRVFASLYQIRKGTPASAIAYAQKVSADGKAAFVFSASNGIELMHVFPPRDGLLRLFDLALQHCRPFKRFIEHNPGQDEIIVDREPYTAMV